jgi:integrase
MAVELKWITHRPAKIRRPREGDGRITYLTADQTERLMECAKASENRQLYPFIIIGVETSMRMMEILSIRPENVDVVKRTIYIPKTKGDQREQSITGHLAEFLISRSVYTALPPLQE